MDDGYNYIILRNNSGVDETHAAIPSLLAVSAVHHYLIDAGKRVQTALIVESGEIREVMHAALLLGYGASALCPYLTYAILDDLVKKGKIQEDYHTAEQNYIKAVKKGLFKIMAKMGISTIRSYRGAKIFESIGLSESLLKSYFGTEVSTIGGIGLETIARMPSAYSTRHSRPRSSSSCQVWDSSTTARTVSSTLGTQRPSPPYSSQPARAIMISSRNIHISLTITRSLSSSATSSASARILSL